MNSHFMGAICLALSSQLVIATTATKPGGLGGTRGTRRIRGTWGGGRGPGGQEGRPGGQEGRQGGQEGRPGGREGRPGGQEGRPGGQGRPGRRRLRGPGRPGP